MRGYSDPRLDEDVMTAISEETSKDMRGWSTSGSRMFASSKRSFTEGNEPEFLEEEEEVEEERVKVPEPQTSFLQLYRYADGTDYLLIFVGTLGAIAHGLVFPVTFLFLGSIIDQFGQFQHSDSKLLLHNVTKISLMYFGLAVSSIFGCWAEIACWMYSGERQTARIRTLYLHSILKQEVAFFDVEFASADFVHQIGTNTLQVQEAISEKMGTYIHNMTTFVGGMVIGFISCWQTSLLTFATIPFIALAGALMTGAQTKFLAQEEAAYLEAGSIADQAISQIRTVYAYVGELRAKEAYYEALQRTYELGHKAAIAKGVGLGVVLGVVNASWALQLWFGGFLVEHGQSRGGKIIIATFCLMFAGLSLGQAAPVLQVFSQGRVAAHKIFGIIERKPLIDPKVKKGKVLTQLEGNIRLKNVVFAYPSRPNQLIFNGFSLDIPKGETVALVGQSGSGKSTVISLIERFYDPISGSVKIDGVNIKQFQLQWLRQQIGLVSQEPVLFNLPIKEAITYGRDDAREDDIIAACKAANAYEFITKLPEGFNTLVGENGMQLSGGQRQRLAIARVILKNPSILLFDEATSALDATNEKLVQTALDNLLLGRTTVVVAHRLCTIQKANLIAVLENGTIVEKGSHSRLLAKNPNGPFARLIQLQGQTPVPDVDAPLSPAMTPTRLAAKEKERRERRIQKSLNVPSASPMHMIALAGSPMSPYTPRHSEIWSMNTDDFSQTDHRDDSFSHSQIHDNSGEDFGDDAARDVSSRLWRLSLSEWPSLTVGIVAAVVTGAYNPFFAFFVIQAASNLYDSDVNEMLRAVGHASLNLFMIGIGSFIANTIQHLSFAHAGEKITKQVRYVMFDRMLQNEVGWYDRDENNSVTLTTRLSNDAASVKAVITDRVSVIVQDIASVAVALVVGFVLEWRVAAVILATFPLLILGGWGQQAFLQGMTGDQRQAHAKANGIAKEAVSNIRTVIAFSAEDTVVQQYNSRLENTTKNRLKEGLLSGLLLGLSQFLLHGAGAFNLWWCAYLTSKNVTTLGRSLKAFQVLSYTAYSLAEAIRLAPDIMKGGQGVAVVFKVIDRETQIEPDNESGRTLPSIKGKLEFVNVEFRYPTRPNVLVLRNFSLTIPSHMKKVALVGASGAGKSSVISLLLRFYDIQSGNILLDGLDIKNLNLRWMRHQFGLVQQEPALFNTSIAENIFYGNEDATEGEMIEASRAANAHQFICSLRHGYETNVGERGKQLSGGQKQRVAIARAILKRPSILLLDEATSALDSESEKVVQEALDRLMGRAKLTLIVAHRLSTIQEADSIVVLENGRVVEEGTHPALIRSGGAYARLVQQQQKQFPQGNQDT